jgi:hypothetical protein
MAKKKTTTKVATTKRKSSYRFTVKMIEDALWKTGALFSHTAKVLGCSQTNVSQRVKNSKRLQKIVEEIKAKNVDFATSQLMELIKQKHPSSIFFYLKCVGGWQETAVITHQGNVEAGVMVVPGRLGSKQWNAMAKAQQTELRALPEPGENDEKKTG